MGCVICSPMQDWELETLTSFMESIYSVKIRQTVEDKICWRFTNSGVFDVKSYYKVLRSGVSCSFSLKEYLEG